MRVSSQALFTVALVGAFALVGGDVLAQGAGNTLYESLLRMVTGSLGLFLGLLLAVWGIWVWVVKQETMAGLLMIAGGVLLTIAPGVMNFIGGVVAPVVKLGGDNDRVNRDYKDLIDLKGKK